MIDANDAIDGPGSTVSGPALLEISSDVAFVSGLSVRSFQSVKGFGAVGIALQDLKRSLHPDQRPRGKPDSDAIIEVHRYHLVAVPVRQMEHMLGVGKQVELPHPFSIARNTFAVHHVSEGAESRSGRPRERRYRCAASTQWNFRQAGA